MNGAGVRIDLHSSPIFESAPMNATLPSGGVQKLVMLCKVMLTHNNCAYQRGRCIRRAASERGLTVHRLPAAISLPLQYRPFLPRLRLFALLESSIIWVLRGDGTRWIMYGPRDSIDTGRILLIVDSYSLIVLTSVKMFRRNLKVFLFHSDK